MSVIKIGYHYTSIENWAKIKREGLQPYTIDRISLNSYLKNPPVQGIWTWLHKQTGLPHIGSILFQMGTKATMQVVLLTYKYDLNDLLYSDLPEYEGDLITLPHDGFIGNLKYHNRKKQETAVILLKPIPPENIDLLDTYNILDAWDH